MSHPTFIKASVLAGAILAAADQSRPYVADHGRPYTPPSEERVDKTRRVLKTFLAAMPPDVTAAAILSSFGGQDTPVPGK